MNDPSQVEFHAKLPDKGMDLDCEVADAETGWQARCPVCPWTSGIKQFKGSVKLAYYRHLEYVGIPLL